MICLLAALPALLPGSLLFGLFVGGDGAMKGDGADRIIALPGDGAGHTRTSAMSTRRPKP